MLMVIDSNNQPFAKAMGALLQSGLQPPSKGEEESFGFVVAKSLILIRQRL